MWKGTTQASFSCKSSWIYGTNVEAGTRYFGLTYPHKENPQNQKPKFGENGSKVARPATRPTPYKL